MRREPCWLIRNELQWVHGPRTVVMSEGQAASANRHGFNGSTVREPWLLIVLSHSQDTTSSFNGSTVREPWLFRALALV